MKIIRNFECRTDDVRVGYVDGEDWIPLENDDGPDDDEIAKLLKKKNANELILRALIDFSHQLRDGLNTDLQELYERSTKE